MIVPTGYVELSRLSATRFGPFPPGGDAARLFRDGSPADGAFVFHAVHGPLNPYVNELGHQEVEYGRLAARLDVIAFACPQLTFACRCVDGLSDDERAAFLESADWYNLAHEFDVGLGYEIAHPGALPHRPECFHRIFCATVAFGA